MLRNYSNIIFLHSEISQFLTDKDTMLKKRGKEHRKLLYGYSHMLLQRFFLQMEGKVYKTGFRIQGGNLLLSH